MSSEFTCEIVMKVLQAQFPWIWCKCLWSNFIQSKILNLTKYNEILKNIHCSLRILRGADLNLTEATGTTNGFIFQIINSLIESWGVCFTYLDCKLSFTCKTFPPSTPLGQVICCKSLRCCKVYCKLQIIISVPRMWKAVAQTCSGKQKK